MKGCKLFLKRFLVSTFLVHVPGQNLAPYLYVIKLFMNHNKLIMNYSGTCSVYYITSLVCYHGSQTS